MFNRAMKRVSLGAALTLGLVSGAFAGGEGGLDYGSLTDAISFDEVGPAVLTAAGALVALYVIILGIRLIVRFVKSG